MENATQRIEDLIEHGYDFKFGSYITEGFDIFKKSWVQFAAFTFVFFAIVIISSFVPIIGSLAVTLVLAPCLIVGLYLVGNRVRNGEDFEFGHFFDGFQFWQNLLVVMLVETVAIIALMVPFFITVGFSFFTSDFLEMGDMPPLPIWVMLLMLPIIYLAVSWHWAPMFVAFYGMKPWEALETSRKVIGKNFFIIFLFLVVVGILAGMGFFLFGIGILLTMPIAYLAYFIAFADVTGLDLDESDSGDFMDDHLDTNVMSDEDIVPNIDED